MTTKVEKSILVAVPISTVYNQWTQFADFPHFMGGVKSVTQLGDDRMKWVAEIAGVRREWEARVVEQVPDQKVAWAATEGATNAGAVTFSDAGGGQTSVHLSLEYEPEGLVEKVGDKLNIVENQAEKDLERFKKFIEDEGYASGAWRGTINEGGSLGTPGVEDAAASRGDDGKSGVSPATVAAGVGAVIAAGAAVAGGVAAAKKAGDDSPDTTTVETVSTPTPVESAPADSGAEGISVAPLGSELGADAGSELGSPVSSYESDVAAANPDDDVTGATDYGIGTADTDRGIR